MTAPLTRDPARLPRQQRCSFTADVRGDDLSGTAPFARGFFLIEQYGGWGRLAVEQSQLDPRVGHELALAAGRASIRPLLIRRTGRRAGHDDGADPTVKRWFRADTAPGRATLRTGTVTGDVELLDVLADPQAGAPVDQPLYGVCTHGRHDACCALRGRPVAQALAELEPEGTWEVSHLGGDRFAANLLVLPWGLYYGRASTDNVEALVTATRAGDVLPELLRGRSAFPPAGQAAQAFARAGSGRLDVDAHRPTALRKVTGERFEVDLEEAGSLTVERRKAEGPAAYLTCSAQVALPPPTWVRV